MSLWKKKKTVQKTNETYWFRRVLDGGETIDLCDKQMGGDGAKEVARALVDTNTKVKFLNLFNNKIGDDGATAIAKALESNSTVTKLNLNNNNIEKDGAMAIAKALESNSTVTALWLGGNKIGKDGATAIAKALKSNSTVTYLDLGHNKIGNEGATAIAKALESNSTVTILYLYTNNIGDNGATAIAKALENNSTVRELLLNHNSIGNEGATAIAKALENNSSVTKLILDHNSIGDDGATAIAKALENSSTVTELSLHNNDIPQGSLNRIKEFLRPGNREKRRQKLVQEEVNQKKKELEQRALLVPACAVLLASPSLVVFVLAVVQSALLLPLLVACVVPPTLLLLSDDVPLPANEARPKQQPHRELEVQRQKQGVVEKQHKLEEETTRQYVTAQQQVVSVMSNYDTGPADIQSPLYFEARLKHSKSLGSGTFGDVFLIEDKSCGKFAVKRIKLGLDDEEREFVRNSFRTEVQVLQRFRHPSLIRMYGFHLSTAPDGIHYLLYEFATRGSLESMLNTVEGRKHLTFSRRIGILLGVAQGLNFLHTGETGALGDSTADVDYTACHRDVKSANICITADYRAKIIDCGLGKLIAKDSKVFESFAKSAQLSSGGGKIGTPAYRDPGYEHGGYKYNWYCDIFSFGVVVAELITGTLSAKEGTHGSGGGGASDVRTIHRKYVYPGKKKRNIREDIDNLISDAPPEFLDNVCNMCLECMDEEVEDRPRAIRAAEKFQRLLTEVVYGCKERVERGKVRGTCSVCRRNSSGLSCGDHFICASHLTTHKGVEAGDDRLECMMEGCNNCYRESDIQSCLSPLVYNDLLQRRVVASDCVFLSHTGQDVVGRMFAALMSEALKEQGINCFYDARSLEAGREWEPAIENNAKGCSIFLCIYSSTYPLRYFCMRELDLAFASRRHIVPVYIEGALPPSDGPDLFKRMRASMRRSRHRVDEPTLRRWVGNISKLRAIQGKFTAAGPKDREINLMKEVVEFVKREYMML